MKVNENLLGQAAASQLGRTQGTAAPGAGGPREGRAVQAQDGDQVSLSNLSGRLLELLADPPGRQAHVERLAADYKAGRYQPDAMAVSQGIIGDALRA